METLEILKNLNKGFGSREIFKALPAKPPKEEPLSRGAHRTAPKGYPKEKKLYADPNNYKYPLDTYDHVRAAIGYFSKPKNNQLYSAEERKAIWGRIKSAAKKHGVELSEDTGKQFEKSERMPKDTFKLKELLRRQDVLKLHHLKKALSANKSLEMLKGLNVDLAEKQHRGWMGKGVQMGLVFKKTGQEIIAAIGGRISSLEREIEDLKAKGTTKPPLSDNEPFSPDASITKESDETWEIREKRDQIRRLESIRRNIKPKETFNLSEWDLEQYGF